MSSGTVSNGCGVCLSVCRSGHRYPIAYSLLGGGVPYPEHRLHWSLGSVPYIRFPCFPVGDGLVPSFPPVQDSSGLLAPTETSCPSPLYFLPICLLSARFCIFSQPPPVSIPHIVRPPLSVCRKATTLRLRPTNVFFCFPSPDSHMQVCTPPRPVRLVVLGLGVGGGAKETAPPTMVLSPLTRLVGVAR